MSLRRYHALTSRAEAGTRRAYVVPTYFTLQTAAPATYNLSIKVVYLDTSRLSLHCTCTRQQPSSGARNTLRSRPCKYPVPRGLQSGVFARLWGICTGARTSVQAVGTCHILLCCFSRLETVQHDSRIASSRQPPFSSPGRRSGLQASHLTALAPSPSSRTFCCSRAIGYHPRPHLDTHKKTNEPLEQGAVSASSGAHLALARPKKPPIPPSCD
ncbi:hypothetical protein HDV57DRAFT_413974 [Trichoderma longibrachiatum]